jgi:tryptophan 2,3-dioxygenase
MVMNLMTQEEKAFEIMRRMFERDFKDFCQTMSESQAAERMCKILLNIAENYMDDELCVQICMTLHAVYVIKI